MRRAVMAFPFRHALYVGYYGCDGDWRLLGWWCGVLSMIGRNIVRMCAHEATVMQPVAIRRRGMLYIV